ncbi:SDR family NAD(P)-dependent oxidoreductase [Hymenobacter sp. HMF4947]|uniref:SDR family NAD(P)-dependent oxidoreductase n=1 Tax=Hymenobacter ginkgonis TaxID=2682976 RepID=A0A7K1TFG3_9BACT|nr:SDR family NAD(P)-dependent oxidoreductase [Hymenobacter ginkgonis]MVN77150.1 SDR family NAD(P)-dependent oxidoreductase [Hymenobacter ginkgonis]
MSTPKTWFVTGASQGLGLTLVKRLLHEGHRVAATSRHQVSLTQAVGTNSAAFLPLQVDLANPASVQQAIEQAISTLGHLDVVVNNAGYGIGGSIEELTDAETRQAFDVNVFGALNVVRAALPHLRAAGAGHIINISSIAAIAGATGWAVYAATKAALSSFSEVLAQDVANFGIRVTVVEPGAFRTNFLTTESLTLPQQPIAAYEAIRTSHAKYLEMNGAQAGDPEKAAAAIMQITTEANPPLHLLLGQDAYQRATHKLEVLGQNFQAWEALTASTQFGG